LYWYSEQSNMQLCFILIFTFINSRRNDIILWNECKQAFPRFVFIISFQNNLPLPHFHGTRLTYSFVLWFCPEFCVILGSSFVRLGTVNSLSIKPKDLEVSLYFIL
jgi:hypothetical protein